MEIIEYTLNEREEHSQPPCARQSASIIVDQPMASLVWSKSVSSTTKKGYILKVHIFIYLLACISKK